MSDWPLDSRGQARGTTVPITGSLDAWTHALVRGWVWDSDHPEARLSVEIRAGGIPLGRVAAGEYREDLKQAGIGNGDYAYRYPLPLTLDTRKHQVSVLVALTNRDGHQQRGTSAYDHFRSLSSTATLS